MDSKNTDVTENEEVKKHKGLVNHVINKHYPKTYEDYDDLVAIGYIGLLQAIRNFNEKGGTPFPSYAYSCIFNSIGNYVNRSYRKKRGKTQTLSLDFFMENGDNFESYLSVVDKGFDIIHSKIDSEIILKKLSPTDQEIVKNSYDTSLRNVGHSLGISGEWVRQRLKKIRLTLVNAA